MKAMYTEADWREIESMTIKESQRMNVSGSKSTGMMKNVKQPNHYTWHPVAECIRIIEHFPYNIATAMQYLWRCEHKGNKEEDLLKAIEHIQYELVLTKKKRIDEPAQAPGYIDR